MVWISSTNRMMFRGPAPLAGRREPDLQTRRGTLSLLSCPRDPLKKCADLSFDPAPPLRQSAAQPLRSLPSFPPPLHRSGRDCSCFCVKGSPKPDAPLFPGRLPDPTYPPQPVRSDPGCTFPDWDSEDSRICFSRRTAFLSGFVPVLRLNRTIDPALKARSIWKVRLKNGRHSNRFLSAKPLKDARFPPVLTLASLYWPLSL